MKMRIALRPARPEDFDYCASVYFAGMETIIEALKLDRAAHAAGFREQWKVTEVRMITLDGADIGWLQTKASEDTLSLGQLFVESAVQRRGIGTQVMRQLIDEAARTHRVMTLSVVKTNPALHLYQRLGFWITHEDDRKFHMRSEAGIPIHIRRMRSEDARAYLQVQRAAVRGIAVNDYPPAVIEQWAPLPITEEAIAEVRANRENEIRLLAEIGDEIVGMGAIIPARNELRACYVAPQAARKGVGSAIIREIERIAREHDLTWLELDASVTSEKFYAGLGYEVRGRGEHVVSSGQSMACVKMRKSLSPHPDQPRGRPHVQ